MTPSLKPFMIYIEQPAYAKLKLFSRKHQTPMSQLAREALDARISSGDRYLAGYNAGVSDSIKKINENPASKMRFPSGASFSEILTADLNKLMRPKNEETTTDAGSTESCPNYEGCSDPGLGV